MSKCHYSKPRYKNVMLSMSTTWQHVMGSRGVASLTLNLNTGWMWVVNFMPWQLYPEERTLGPTDLEAGWTPEPVCFGEMFFALVRNQTLDCAAHNLITIYIAVLASSPDITLFIIFIVVFDLSLSFLAVMADPVSLTTSPVHSEVFDWNRNSLCRSCGELLVHLNRDFWRWSTGFF